MTIEMIVAKAAIFLAPFHKVKNTLSWPYHIVNIILCIYTKLSPVIFKYFYHRTATFGCNGDIFPAISISVSSP